MVASVLWWFRVVWVTPAGQVVHFFYVASAIGGSPWPGDNMFNSRRTSVLRWLVVSVCGLWVVACGGVERDGAALYQANCSTCHGIYGEGDGPASPSLAHVTQDLRYIAQRNGGEFPRELIYRIIDGREARAPHLRGAMPVWGDAFARAEGYTADSKGVVRAKLDALVDFLEEMQIRQ
jgi:hypothetical protein